LHKVPDELQVTVIGGPRVRCLYVPQDTRTGYRISGSRIAATGRISAMDGVSERAKDNAGWPFSLGHELEWTALHP